MRYELAQVNIGRLLAPIDSPQIADFMAALDPVNASADAAPGFVWRLQTEEGNATAVEAFQWDQGDSAGIIMNMSVWRSLDELADWVFGELHRQILRRRREWFEHMAEATMALWWVPAGHTPSTDEAEDRIRLLRAHGPTPSAFTFRQTFPAPAGDGADEVSEPATGNPDWLCPA